MQPYQHNEGGAEVIAELRSPTFCEEIKSAYRCRTAVL